MDIKIGVQHTAREVVIESDQSADEVEEAVLAAIKDGGTLKLTDSKGGAVLVPVASLGYVEIGAQPRGAVGFGLS